MAASSFGKDGVQVAHAKSNVVSVSAKAAHWQAVSAGDAGAGLVLLYVAVTERDAVAAKFRVFDGVDNTGTLLASVNVVSDVRELKIPALPCEGGIYVERLAGTVDIVLGYARM